MFRVADGQTLVLGSASPRRSLLLESLGLNFDLRSSDINEDPLPAESGKELVCRLALEKASDVAANTTANSWVLGADTVVELNGKVLVKPSDREEAQSMIASLAGKTHLVLGGIALVNTAGGIARVEHSATQVSFVELDSGLISAYCNTDEPYDKAGAYGIQGLAASFVEKIEGSYSNVVGLDLAVVIRLLREAGVIVVEGS